MGRKRKSPKISRAQKAVIACTTTLYRPRPDPPTRNYEGPFRRVLQINVNVDNDLTSWVDAKTFFTEDFNTSGYSALHLHRVSVWGGITSATSFSKFVLAALGSKTEPGHYAGLVYKDYADQENRRARVGFYVPSHLSGFDKTSPQMIAMSGDKAYVVEIDATFV